MAGGNGSARVRVEVLGTLRLIVDGVVVDVRGPKRRAVLALLALAEGRPVTIGQLLDALWPAEVPETGRQVLHTHMSRLRGHLGPAADRLQTQHEGYRLELGAEELDLTQARTLLARARPETGRDPAGALALLQEAYALRRGPVLADLTDTAPIATAVEEYAQLHREVTDALVASAVGAGQADQVLGLAAASLAVDPLREPAVLLFMRALAATGQAAEALRTGREYRHRLSDETGLDPSPALGELERDIASGAAGPPPTVRAAPIPSRAGGGRAPARPEPAAPSDASTQPVAGAQPTTRLIGREATVATLHRLLASERLVTLVGPGGVGKTRVAVEVARTSGVAPVLMLAPVTDPAAVPHALAAALGLNVVQGDVLSACVAVLADRGGLLVIDNCEHLLDTVRDTVGVVLSRCPTLSVLATSREPLGLGDEYASRLAPLPLPGVDQELADVPSVAVFLDRAVRVRPGFAPSAAELAAVGEIVARLDGMPLAIELAAGRLSTFSLADLHGRLDRALDLLGGRAADSRHRTLRATVEWSYELLAEDERRLFRALSVFVDGVDLATAEAVAADLGLAADPGSVLSRLVDASMIEASFEGPARYRMLETLRTYGQDRLAAGGEQDDAQRALVQWAVGLTAWFEATVTTDREPDADAALRLELANLRAAWHRARERGCLDDAAAIVTALFDAVVNRDLVEIRGWAEELADDPALDAHPRAAAVLGTAAYAAYHRGDHPGAERRARAGLTLTGDAGGSSHCRHALAVAALARGAYGEVIEHCLAGEASGIPRHYFLGIAALAAAYAGDQDEARALIERSLAGGGSPSMRAWASYFAGEIENSAGRSEPAEQHYVRALSLARTSGATFAVGVATVGLLSVRAASGRVREALAGYREVIDYFARVGNWTHQWTTLRNLAELLRRLGDPEPAAVLDAAADRAPDAPAVDGSAATTTAPDADPAAPGRDAVLELARHAIQRHLSRS